MQSEDLGELAKALVAIQGELKAVKKTASNPFFKSKYTPLNEVMEAVLPITSKHGVAVTQFVTNLDGTSALTTTLIHSSGQYISGTMPLLLPKNDPQGQGSSITYARRYGIMAALGIVADEDDDGNKAVKSYTKAPEQSLATAKSDLLKAFWKAKVSNFDDQKTIIEAAIGKSTIDDIDDVDAVIEYLKTHKEK